MNLPIEKWYTGDDGCEYFRQRSAALGEHVQALRASLFADLGGELVTILDFGCGTGGVLKRLVAASRFGVEIGEEAAKIARCAGITVVGSLDELPEDTIDVAISFHAIEHVDDPLATLSGIGRVVKPGGHIRLVVPCETPLLPGHRTWRPNPDRHLYTWTPLLFGNLAHRAGLTDIRVIVAPMPTGSRLVRWLRPLPPLARVAHLGLSLRRNSLNVILDAGPPERTDVSANAPCGNKEHDSMTHRSSVGEHRRAR